MTGAPARAIAIGHAHAAGLVVAPAPARPGRNEESGADCRGAADLRRAQVRERPKQRSVEPNVRNDVRHGAERQRAAVSERQIEQHQQRAAEQRIAELHPPEYSGTSTIGSSLVVTASTKATTESDVRLRASQ